MTDKISAGALRAAHWWLDDSVTDEHEINALAVCIDRESGLGELIQLVEDMDRFFQKNYHGELHGHMVWNADDVSLRDHVHSLLSRVQGKD